MRKYCPRQQFGACHPIPATISYRRESSSLKYPPQQKQQKNAICAANLTMIAKNVERAGKDVYQGGGF